MKWIISIIMVVLILFAGGILQSAFGNRWGTPACGTLWMLTFIFALFIFGISMGVQDRD